MLVWKFLKILAVKINKTIDQVKQELLLDYLSQEFKKPTIRLRTIFISYVLFTLVLNMVSILRRSL